MNRAIAWFAQNHVAANLLMLLLIVGGLSSLPSITQKSFPDVDVDIVQVSVEYRGAAPEETEAGVCVRIEEEVEGVEGIEKISSTSVEGACVVSIELISGSDVDKALDDVKNRVDSLDTLPEEAEKPIVSRVAIKRLVVDIAISGDAGERTLKRLAERVRDEISRLPGITQVEVLATRPYEISLEISEASLRRHGLTFDQVADAVRRSSFDLPGGSIKAEGGEVLLRTQGQAHWGEEFEGIVVVTREDGSRIHLGQIANVVDGFEDTDQSARFDGQPTAIVRVYRVGNQDLLEISDTVASYIEQSQLRMPDGVRLTVWRDASIDLRDRRDTMLRNGRAGYLLVLAVLALFLRVRLAFWVSLGIPISFLGGFWLMPMVGITINMISLFGLILVLGILVDDAIVIGENVYTHQQRGEDPLAASIKGTQEVSVPVIFGVLTTIVAFCPMLLIGGRMGQVFSVIAGVVILCLIFSLIESQLVLPTHLGHGAVAREGRSNPVATYWRAMQTRFASAFERLTYEHYGNLLRRAMHWRYTTVTFGIALLMCAVAMVASGRMNFSFFPDLQANYVSGRITLPQGTPVEVTELAVRQIEEAVAALRAELDPEFAGENPSLVKHVMSAVGQQPFKAAQGQNPAQAGSMAGVGSHLGEVTIELVAAEQRAISTAVISARWRELTGSIPGAEELTFDSALFSIGDAMNFQLQGPNVDDLQRAADRIKQQLATYPGATDITDSFRAGKQEIKLAIRPEAESLGIGLRDLARQVRQAFYGEEAQRIQRGRDDVRVMVRYPRSERRSLGDLEDMRIRTPDGAEVPFEAVAVASLGHGYSSIRRADRQRVINVIGRVDRNVMTSNEIIADMEAGPLPEILADYPGMTYRLEGMQREQQRAFGALARWYLIALFGIYALLAVPLRSYGQPLIIMSVIPFGVVGAIGGHLFMGLFDSNLGNLSMMSIFGIVALTGVVVNSSLVLVHYINGARARGASIVEAVHEAGVVRFRPIVLTALTTFVGLTPLLLERSVQAQFLIPMATSLAFGVLVATMITLLIVPSGYLILDDLQSLSARLRAGWRTQRNPARGPVREPREVVGAVRSQDSPAS